MDLDPTSMDLGSGIRDLGTGIYPRSIEAGLETSVHLPGFPEPWPESIEAKPRPSAIA